MGVLIIFCAVAKRSHHFCLFVLYLGERVPAAAAAASVSHALSPPSFHKKKYTPPATHPPPPRHSRGCAPSLRFRGPRRLWRQSGAILPALHPTSGRRPHRPRHPPPAPSRAKRRAPPRTPYPLPSRSRRRSSPGRPATVVTLPGRARAQRTAGVPTVAVARMVARRKAAGVAAAAAAARKERGAADGVWGVEEGRAAAMRRTRLLWKETRSTSTRKTAAAEARPPGLRRRVRSRVNTANDEMRARARARRDVIPGRSAVTGEPCRSRRRTFRHLWEGRQT